MARALQQGTADGLCGIYSILNFLQTTDWLEYEASTGLEALLECANHFGWFTPSYVTNGFEDYQLKKILDYQIEAYRLPYQTFFIADTLLQRGNGSFSYLAQSLKGREGSALIASKSRRSHWVLIKSHNGKMIILDSANGGAKSELPDRSSGYLKNCGLVIIKGSPKHLGWKE